MSLESLKELWAKEFLPNMRKEIRLEIDSLKASLLDLKKSEKPNKRDQGRHKQTRQLWF